MGQMLRLLAGLLFVLILATVAMAQGKPTPAWCGGSYSITGGLEPKDYVEAVKAGQPIRSGTNFGECPANTYPAFPSAQVTFSADGRAVYMSGEVDKDGKAIVVELTLPATPK